MEALLEEEVGLSIAPWVHPIYHHIHTTPKRKILKQPKYCYDGNNN